MKKLLIKKGAMLVQDSLTIRYLTGLNVEEGYLVIDDEWACFTDARYFSMLKPQIESINVTPVLLKDFNTVADYIKNRGHKQVLIDFERTSVSEYKKIKAHFKVKDYSIRIKKMRSVKDKTELQSIVRACKIVQTAYHNVIKKVKVGMTELELKDMLESEMLSLGAQGTSFETIVAFGTNGAVPHHKTGQTKLTNNVPILIDAGCKVNGYCSDITRTAFFGTPSKEFLDCYDAVLKANESAIEKIACGVTTCDADGYARTVLSNLGLGEYFTHSLGHGVGLEIHEYPTLSPRSKEKLKNNVVFTIEPGVYIDGKFGIRIEDTVVLKNGKVKRLFTDDKNLILLK